MSFVVEPYPYRILLNKILQWVSSPRVHEFAHHSASASFLFGGGQFFHFFTARACGPIFAQICQTMFFFR